MDAEIELIIGHTVRRGTATHDALLLDFSAAQITDVAVFRLIEWIQESVLDVVVGLAKTDVKHVRRHAAGNGQ